jgi:hypothetical protein
MSLTKAEPQEPLASQRSKSVFERATRVLWAVPLVVPLPIVLSAIHTSLLQIPNWPAYAFSNSVWCVAAIAFVAMVFSRWDRVERLPDTLPSRLLFIAGIVCLAVSVCVYSPSLATAGWVLYSGAWLATHGDEREASQGNSYGRLLGHWPALCVLTQFPAVVQSQVAKIYYDLLARVVGVVFDALRIPFHAHDHTFEFSQSTFSIVDSLVAAPTMVWTMFVYCMIIAWLRRPVVLLPAYMGLATLWTFGMHALQFIVIATVRQRFELDFTVGWLSIALSVSTLAIAFGLFLSSDRLMQILFMPVPLEETHRGPLNPIIRAWNSIMLPMATAHRARS